jgi:hypothetical protein
MIFHKEMNSRFGNKKPVKRRNNYEKNVQETGSTPFVPCHSLTPLRLSKRAGIDARARPRSQTQSELLISGRGRLTT